MASMEKDIQDNLHPVSSHQTGAIRPLASAYYEAKNELDRLDQEEKMRGGMGAMPMSEDYWKKREGLWKIVRQYEDNYNYRLRGNSTIDRVNISAPSRDDTDR